MAPALGPTPGAGSQRSAAPRADGLVAHNIFSCPWQKPRLVTVEEGLPGLSRVHRFPEMIPLRTTLSCVAHTVSRCSCQTPPQPSTHRRSLGLLERRRAPELGFPEEEPNSPHDPASRACCSAGAVQKHFKRKSHQRQLRQAQSAPHTERYQQRRDDELVRAVSPQRGSLTSRGTRWVHLRVLVGPFSHTNDSLQERGSRFEGTASPRDRRPRSNPPCSLDRGGDARRHPRRHVGFPLTRDGSIDRGQI